MDLLCFDLGTTKKTCKYYHMERPALCAYMWPTPTIPTCTGENGRSPREKPSAWCCFPRLHERSPPVTVAHHGAQTVPIRLWCVVAACPLGLELFSKKDRWTSHFLKSNSGLNISRHFLGFLTGYLFKCLTRLDQRGVYLGHLKKCNKVL